MLRRVLQKASKPVISSLIVGVIIAVLFLTGGLEELELISLDLKLRHLPRAGSAPVSFVLIDQNTLKTVGKWPFPRGVLARVLDQVSQAGADGILVDVDLSSTSPDEGQDRKLEKAVKDTGKVVLAVQWEERNTIGGALIRNISLPGAALAAGALDTGGITFQVDRDGAIRRMPPVLEYGEDLFHPMGVVGARLLDPEAGRDVPENAHINFSYDLLTSVPVVPFHKVLEGDFKADDFKDRIVLLGASSPDLHDHWVTPVGVIPGVLIQASVLETALNRSWHVRQASGQTVLLIVFTSLVAGALMSGTGWRGGLIILGLFLVTVLSLSAWSALYGFQVQVVPLLLVPMINYPLRLGIQISGTEKKLVHEKQRTEAILELTELHKAEGSGQDLPTVPLVLLKQILGFDRIILYLAEETRDPRWRPEMVLDERNASMRWHPEKVNQALESGEYEIDRGKSLAVYAPLMTANKTMGVLFAEGPPSLSMEMEDIRLLLAHTTQTAYLLEFREMEGKVRSLYSNSLKAFIKALGAKDRYTGAHAELSQEYVELFGRASGLNAEQIQSLHIGALLHDIGKIGIPDSILTKTEELTIEEYEVMKKHPAVGFDIIRDLPFPEDVRDIILCHHENYDGSGYPRGLAGRHIPLVARIFSILDTFEALVGKRPYKDPVPEKEAIDTMRQAAGSQFDPELLSTFMSCLTYRRKEAAGE